MQLIGFAGLARNADFGDFCKIFSKKEKTQKTGKRTEKARERERKTKKSVGSFGSWWCSVSGPGGSPRWGVRVGPTWKATACAHSGQVGDSLPKESTRRHTRRHTTSGQEVHGRSCSLSFSLSRLFCPFACFCVFLFL